MKVIVGIDPGLSGGIAIYRAATGHLDVWDMPVLEMIRNGKIKREVSPQMVAGLIAGQGITHAFVEKVNAMPGQGVTSVFSFGLSTGILLGVLAAYEIPTTLVTPQAWQKRVEQRAGKDGSRERAMQLFPSSAELFKRKKDDGRSDAALIAFYGSLI